jgi:hypothetical protein
MIEVIRLHFSNTTPHNFKFDDYITYFGGTENYIDSLFKNEGIVLRLTWSAIDVFNLILRFRTI